MLPSTHTHTHNPILLSHGRQLSNYCGEISVVCQSRYAYDSPSKTVYCLHLLRSHKSQTIPKYSKYNVQKLATEHLSRIFPYCLKVITSVFKYRMNKWPIKMDLTTNKPTPLTLKPGMHVRQMLPCGSYTRTKCECCLGCSLSNSWQSFASTLLPPCSCMIMPYFLLLHFMFS